MDTPPPDPSLPARLAMVENQLRRRGIRDSRVLDAMTTVPRHRFLPPNLTRSAYEDSALPAGEGQTISQPYIVAHMTEDLRLEPHHLVLEIGTGTGYQTAILAELVPHGHVYTIERIPALALAARQHLANYSNISFHIGDGSLGWPICEGLGVRGQGLAEETPASPPNPYPLTPPIFHRILITAGAPAREPQPLLDQLALGGIMIIPEGALASQTLCSVTRTGPGPDDFRRAPLLPCRFVPLLGQFAWPED